MTLKNMCSGLSVLFIFTTLGCATHAEYRASYFGSPFLGVALDGYPITEAHLKVVEREIGFMPQMVVFFLQWPPPENVKSAIFPEETLEAIWNSGAIPCLTWEPMYYINGREMMVPYTSILEGSYDPYLLEFARRAREWKKPFLIRFAHEMNLDRYHWGTEKHSYGPDSPDIYKKMYHYVVNTFRKVGVRNVLWVFCPNAESVPNSSYDPDATWNRAANYYPGDAYVDILGIDGYNWGTTRTKEKHGWNSRWQTFEEIFAPTFSELRALAPNKPILIFETASVTEGGDKAFWIREAFKTADKWQIPGIVWFHVLKDNDWRIHSGVSRDDLIFLRKNRSSSMEWLMGHVK